MSKPGKKRKYTFESVENTNLSILAELVADPQTSEHLRVNIINKLLESRVGQNFFLTMFEEGLSFGACPCCGHENHWLIPEDALNEMGWVSFKKDPNVPSKLTSEICPEYAEACQKKKTSA
jgi:hypothetical protein